MRSSKWTRNYLRSDFPPKSSSHSNNSNSNYKVKAYFSTSQHADSVTYCDVVVSSLTSLNTNICRILLSTIMLQISVPRVIIEIHRPIHNYVKTITESQHLAWFQLRHNVTKGMQQWFSRKLAEVNQMNPKSPERVPKLLILLQK